jgi:hypothetical protein
MILQRIKISNGITYSIIGVFVNRGQGIQYNNSKKLYEEKGAPHPKHS